MDRFRRLGLQRRIMLYVTAGVVLLFGVVALVGLQSIDEATNLVYNERLTTAFTTAQIIERDLATVASEARIAATSRPVQAAPGMADEILGQLSDTGRFPFFSVSGVWILDRLGNVIETAGEPGPPAQGSTDGGTIETALAATPADNFVTLQALGDVPGEQAFAVVAVRVAATGDAIAVSTVSRNSRQPYVPALYGREDAAQEVQPPATEAYHLEVVDPSGIAVLGVGEDERPGEPSTHFPAIRTLMEQRGAAAMLHQPSAGQTFAAHVMAVVPLGDSPFYVVIEQPVDVALALPLELRQRLFLLTAIGLLATLGVAYITTRHVVKPTEQLTAAAQRIAAGDLASPIAVAAEDEVATLADSLETMRQRLESAYAAAERVNRELEARVAERTARLGQLVRTTITAQEEERYRLARELHDETAQTLAALSIALDRARDSMNDKSPALERIAEARDIAQRLLAETRRLILGLRPALLDDLGLVPAIRWHCENTFNQRGVDVSIEADRLTSRLPGPIEVALFRIVQEALNNAQRHADPKHVWVELAMTDFTVQVVVRDDGRGFDIARMASSDGTGSSVGLLGMQERVTILNGTFRIESGNGGTAVRVEVPLAEGGATA